MQITDDPSTKVVIGIATSMIAMELLGTIIQHFNGNAVWRSLRRLHYIAALFYFFTGLLLGLHQVFCVSATVPCGRYRENSYLGIIIASSYRFGTVSHNMNNLDVLVCVLLGFVGVGVSIMWGAWFPSSLGLVDLLASVVCGWLLSIEI